eukprot:2099788-Rhodomonas_salina.6
MLDPAVCRPGRLDQSCPDALCLISLAMRHRWHCNAARVRDLASLQHSRARCAAPLALARRQRLLDADACYVCVCREQLVYIPVPDRSSRLKIFQSCLRKSPL